MSIPVLAASLAVLVLTVAMLPGGPAPAVASVTPAAATRPFRVIESDASGVTLEYSAPEPRFVDRDTPFGRFQAVTLDGHAGRIELGRPSLPTAGAGLAIPDGVEPRLTVRSMESATLPGIRPLPSSEGAPDAAVERLDGWAYDRRVYEGTSPYPAEAVAYSEVGRLRHHRVGQVVVSPVRFDPLTGGVTVVSRATIRLDFVPARGRSAAATVRTTPVGSEGAWEETYRNALLNYEAARAFRTRPLPDVSTALETRGGTRVGIQAPAATPGAPAEFRIYVGRTDLYYASYADLASAGWPADIPVDRIRFYEKGFDPIGLAPRPDRDVPIVMEESGTPDGLFNGDDVFYFYGLDFADRFRVPFAVERFTGLHVYWLSWSDAPAARMTEVAGWFEAESFATPESYVHETRWEQNSKYIFTRSGGDSPDFPDRETHYWLDAGTYRDSLQFETPGRNPTRPFRLSARWQGVFNGTHYVSLWLTRGCAGVVNDTLLVFKAPFGSRAAYVYDSDFTIPGARLADGCNRLKVQGNGFAAGQPESEGSGAYFDGFDVDYYRSYVASGGVLRFTSADLRGNVEFVIRGLPDTTLYVFDVTDSLAPARVSLAGARFRQVSGPPRREFELRFRAVADRQRTWVLYAAASLRPVTAAVARMPPDLGARNIQRDEPADILANRDADVIVIAHPAFRAALDPWIARRESEPYKHRVLVVSPQDIWDQVSGGHKSVPAIRSWLRTIFRTWTRPPDHLVLFGDGSEDYRNDLTLAEPDWVPTMMLFGPVSPDGDRLELVGSDTWYVAALAAGSSDADVIPDMHVGRLSVGTMAEAEALVAKLVAYDTYSPDDAWRNRGLIVSDDRYSTPLSANGDYAFETTERLFAAGADSLAGLLDRRSCATGFLVEQFRLEEVLAAAPCVLNRTYQTGNRPDLGSTIECAKRYAAPKWVETASRGHLFQMYSGHANRFVMGTERFVEFSGNFTSPDYRTIEQLANYGKPFIYFGVACHLNEFESFQEKETQSALGEALVLLPGRGAVASIASTAYELLSTNLWVEYYLGRVIFSEHPIDPATGRPRRILGEGVDQGLVRMALERGTGINSSFMNCLKTYFLIGDPTMRVDMAPPTLQVTVDGAPAVTGAAIVAAAGGETATIRALLADDVDYGREGLTIVDHGATVPADRYTVTPVGESGGCRGAQVEYTATLEPSSYPITLRARDWIGRELTFTLNVNLGLAYFVNGSAILPGGIVAGDAPLEIRIVSPVSLQGTDIDVRMNGEPGYFTVSGEDRAWTATTIRSLPEGPVELETRIRGTSSGTLSITARNDVAFNEIYFYPSPWSGEGSGRFTYQLSFPPGEDGRKATVTVFSVSGRKVISLDGPVETGRNWLDWDMKDAQGDGLANGVYLYKVVVETSTGRKLSTLDRLVVHR